MSHRECYWYKIIIGHDFFLFWSVEGHGTIITRITRYVSPRSRGKRVSRYSALSTRFSTCVRHFENLWGVVKAAHETRRSNRELSLSVTRTLIYPSRTKRRLIEFHAPWSSTFNKAQQRYVLHYSLNTLRHFTKLRTKCFFLYSFRATNNTLASIVVYQLITHREDTRN